MVKRYKSWKALKNQLEDLLCAELKGRVTYFLTRYHKVHNSYGRAAILFDGKELVCFSWTAMYDQEYEISKLYNDKTSPFAEVREELEKEWDNNCTYCDMDFLTAALEFTDMPIEKALQSENSIIRILAVMDRRAGKRTLEKISVDSFPDWAKQFYKLRLEN